MNTDAAGQCTQIAINWGRTSLTSFGQGFGLDAAASFLCIGYTFINTNKHDGFYDPEATYSKLSTLLSSFEEKTMESFGKLPNMEYFTPFSPYETTLKALDTIMVRNNGTYEEDDFNICGYKHATCLQALLNMCNLFPEYAS